MVSIIIPVFNKLEMTRDCIDSIRANTKIPYEIIIVDNGSNPIAESKLKDADVCPMFDISFIRNSENLGFPKAVNQGIAAANGDIIILLNNDVIVTPEWASLLSLSLERCDIVAPVTNYCAGRQQVVLPTYHNEFELNKVALEWGKKNLGVLQEVNWVIGFCMAFKKSLFDTLGAFDESLWPCSGEELDWCLRARSKGFKVAIARDVYLHHFGSQTFMDMQRDGQLNYAEICKRNDNHVAKRWGSFWENQLIEK